MHNCLLQAGFGTRLSRPPAGTQPSARTSTCTHIYMYACTHIQPHTHTHPRALTYTYFPQCAHHTRNSHTPF